MRSELAFLLLTGCAGPESESFEVRTLDYDDFEQIVQPVLAEDCGNPSCHGRPERPFAIYSSTNWRADPARLFLDEPLSTEELEHNYWTSCVFSTDGQQPADTLLLRKPLGSYSHSYHGGGDVFRGTTDRNYRKLHEWIGQDW